MCGITGILSLSPKDDLTKPIRAMTRTINYRGPDGDGFWIDDKMGVALGHRRLAILDLSPAGHQPMQSASGRFVMSYNGEIYNYLYLQAALEEKGHKFRGHSDTEVLLTAFEEYGVQKTLEKISGMFAIILWDRLEGTITLLRDPLGKKPLYIGWAGDSLLIASELKALKAAPDFKPEVNPDVQALYLKYACVPAPYSIYKGTWQLLPGHSLTLNPEKLEKRQNLTEMMVPYWSPSDIIEKGHISRQQPHNDETVIGDFSKLLSQCVRERMISDVPLGAFLSGGIDSSTIVALMQKQSSRPVKTFSIGFEAEGFNEAEFAKEVANHLGTEHHEMYLTPKDALDVIPDLPRIYDEPFADISQIPTYLVSKFAREHVTVALSGDGGDELLGGYRRHFLIPPIWGKLNKMPHSVRKALGRMLSTLNAGGLNALWPKRDVLLSDSIAKLSGLMRQDDWVGVHDFLLGFWEDPYKIVPEAHYLPLPFNDRKKLPDNLSFAEELMWRDSISYLPNDILTKVDRASMAVSLEARAPLLDKRLYEHVWGLPEHMKIRGGKGKWLLRQVLARHIPEEMFDRPKKGFSPPLAEWLRGDLRGWAEELLRPERLEANGFNPKSVTQAWDLHQSGQRNIPAQLWAVLMYQAWKEKEKS